MAATVGPEHLSNHHRNTLREIMHHPAGRNIEWRSVVSLIGAVGSINENKNGKFQVTVGPETEIFERPKHDDVDPQTVTDLRRMLIAAGYRSESHERG